MFDFDMYSFLEEVKIGSRDDLLSKLEKNGNIDCDFNGENGDEYLWGEFDSSKYKSNLEYMLAKVKNIEDDTEAINTFFNVWMDRENNYYNKYREKVLTNDEGQVYAFSFMAIHTY